MNNIEWISSRWWSESIDTQNLSVEKLEGESGESPPFPQYHNILIIVFVWLPDIHNTSSSSSSTTCSSVIKVKVHPKMKNSYLIVFGVLN